MNKKSTGMICAALAVLGLAGPPLARLTGAQARASEYSVREDPAVDAAQGDVVLDGVISRVDVDRDRVTLTTDAGRAYTLDTSRFDLTQRGTDRSGQTADLTRGMRLHVTGTRLSDDIVQADRVRILRDQNTPLEVPAPSSPDDTDSINLRGTVESVDQRRASFVVHINQHTRTVFLDDTTTLPQASPEDSDRVPLHPGDRVTVSGVLRADGTVVADTVSLGQPAKSDRREITPRDIEGRVTSRSSRYTNRDLKIRLSSGREVTVHVPAGIPITRDNQPISVHELTTRDVVRVTGTFDGDDFRADSIAVTRSYDDE